MLFSSLLLSACIFVYSLVLCESMPIAFPQLVVVQPASYALIRLRGYDVNVPNVRFVTTVSQIPLFLS